ncbi:transmembrane protein 45B-like [Actinia tenebrosa]|uniref:Transmembrane protein 45B-like n=1 Tax=Actinia tenebrosa TaxID=6105 RepID=A0A6P8J3T5_ACTTE|nr:transmembrane protein 45B-like [Actinia tenebrosa]
MGTFRGHVLPGSFFTVFGVWGLYNVLKIFIQCRFGKKEANKDYVHFRSTTWFPMTFCKFVQKLPVEPLIKIIATIIGILGELNSGNWSLFDKNGVFHNLGNFAHVTMFALFTLGALFEVFQFFEITTLSLGAEHLSMSLAFFIEGLLFYFHLHGRPVLDVRLHTLLYVVVFATSFVLVLEAWMKDSFLLLVVRVYLVMLQGTWFFQIAHSLYGVNPWKDTPPNREIIPVVFACHVAVWFALFVVSFMIVSLKSQRKCCGSYSRASQHTENLNMQKLEDSERENLIIEYQD